MRREWRSRARESGRMRREGKEGWGGNGLAQEGRRVRVSLVKSRITEGENRGVCSTEASRLQRRKC